MIFFRVSRRLTVFILWCWPWKIQMCEDNFETTGNTSSSACLYSFEARLLRHLLDRYKTMGKFARPVRKSSHPLNVYFGMRLIKLSISEREQTMTTSVWARQSWRDEYLRWDPKQFGGLDKVTMPWKKVWTPDITLSNTAHTTVGQRPADLMVEYNGRVSWAPHKVYTSACLIDVTNYPFDVQTCDMWFQSMAKLTRDLTLKKYFSSPLDMETYLASYKDSQEWEIITNTTTEFIHSRDVGVILKFSRRKALRFRLVVRRRPGFTCYLLMMPCIFLACLTALVFCLPPDRQDRHMLAMSLFSSFMLLLLILVQTAPPSAASTAKLGIYYMFNMVLIMSTIFLSTLVISTSRQGVLKKPVPDWVHTVFIQFLAKVLLMQDCVSDSLHRMHSGQMKINHAESAEEPQNFRPSENHLLPRASSLFWKNDETQQLTEAPHGFVELITKYVISTEKRLDKMQEILDKLADRVTGSKSDASYTSSDKRLEMHWRHVAMVMDRLFCLCCVLAIVTSFILFFPRP